MMRHMKRIISFVTLLLLFISATVWAESVPLNKPLRVISSNNFPPINFLNNDGELTGFGRDISDAALNALGIKLVRTHKRVWNDVLKDLASGEVDFIHDTGYVKERETYLDFSDPIIEMNEVIFVRDGRVDINTLDSLRGKRVACVNNHITHIYLKQFKEITCHIVATPLDGVVALISGEVDAYIYPKEIVSYFLLKLNVHTQVKIVGEPLRTLSWHMAVKDGNKEVLDKLNNGIREIKRSGEYQRIYEKWFGVGIFPGYSRGELLAISLGLIFVSLLFGLVVGLVLHTRKLTATRNQLVHSESRYRELGENVPGGIYRFCRSTDGVYSIPFISRAFERITGLNVEEIQQNSDVLFKRIHEDHLNGLLESIEDSARHMTKWSYVFKLQTTHGNYIWFRGVSTPRKGVDGTILWDGLLLDITDLEQAQRALKQAYENLEERVESRTDELKKANLKLQDEMSQRERIAQEVILARDEAEQANRAKSQFLSRMSHELRTPLNAIIGFSYILQQEQDRLTEDEQDYIKQIHDAGRYLFALITEVLDLSRIEADELQFEYSTILLTTLLDKAVVMVRDEAENYRVNLQIDSEVPAGYQITTDVQRMQQVIINLLSNAIKYNREGGAVFINSKLENSRLLIEVCDTGIGIAEEQQRHLFESFNRLGQEQSNIPGTGIGLVITRRIIENMGGELSFTSEQGQGSCFTVRVNSDAEQKIQTVLARASNMNETTPSHFPKTILYIEDIEANIKVVRAILKSQAKQCNLLAVKTAEEGLVMALEQQPDLILMDINLPDMDGLEATRRLKSKPETVHIPVIALTADAMPQQIEKADNIGFSAYITKPIDMSSFIDTLSSVYVSSLDQ